MQDAFPRTQAQVHMCVRGMTRWAEVKERQQALLCVGLRLVPRDELFPGMLLVSQASTLALPSSLTPRGGSGLERSATRLSP